MRVLAIDPGHTCGIAVLSVTSKTGLLPPAPHRVASVKPGHVYDLLERPSIPGRYWDAVVCEEFRLYPWLATHQAFSELRTVEVIGVIKYLTAVRQLPLYMQKADVKRGARGLAEERGWSMVTRTLGSGRGKYRGPDFDYPGPQHGRDALAHGVHWAFRSPESPAYAG